ncbi:YbhB/YbcL family Raf kinase inhibitor-like protein [Candidatus Kaiserbacteria bacterium]|nr:YbhB/YbcL family Raf kinase inhibitor-like protein [Candidatus Kaiserbacteria bacterium]
MRNAYALLGAIFLLVFAGAYVAFDRAHAPTTEGDLPDTNTHTIMTLTSPAFEEGGIIPSKYTCDGDNVNPELHVAGVPEGAASLVLVMDDPDIPDAVKERLGTEKFDHWVLYNIPADTSVIAENTSVGNEGLTSRGETGYVGSCPPDGEHRYIFRLYALSGTLNFLVAPTLDEVETAAASMALESTTLTGRYSRVQE